MDVKNVKALGDRLVIKIEKEPDKTPGGLIIPNTNKTKTEMARIINIGSGCAGSLGLNENLEIKVGDKVIYDKYAGIQLNIKDEEYLVVKIDDIFAVIEE
jgi:chaperonin GroES